MYPNPIGTMYRITRKIQTDASICIRRMVRTLPEHEAAMVLACWCEDGQIVIKAQSQLQGSTAHIALDRDSAIAFADILRKKAENLPVVAVDVDFDEAGQPISREQATADALLRRGIENLIRAASEDDKRRRDLAGLGERVSAAFRAPRHKPSKSVSLRAIVSNWW